MSDARHAILAAIRGNLGRGPVEPVSARALEERLRGSPGAPRPALAGEPLERFRERALRAAASVETVDRRESIPTAVAACLEQREQAQRLVCGTDPWLTGLDWAGRGIEIREGTAGSGDAVGLSRADLAVAETGSVVLLAGPGNPTRINFLPEIHIVVVEAERVVAGLEEVWTELRRRGLPRAVNFVTGPSRTADIEQTLQLGAHGPRHLHLILVGG